MTFLQLFGKMCKGPYFCPAQVYMQKRDKGGPDHSKETLLLCVSLRARYKVLWQAAWPASIYLKDSTAVERI
jgi:hypothetical protein